MQLIDYLINQILPLPWTVKGPGVLLIAALVLRAITRFLTLRWVRALTNLVMALVTALFLARYGSDLATYIANLLNA